MRIFKLAMILGAALILLVPTFSWGSDSFAVWLDGITTDPAGGGNGIVSSLENTFGASSVTLVSTAQLETPGFLNSFNCVIVSRYDSEFGTGLSATAAANIASYVGVAGSANQGGVALFTNDVADNFYGATTGDVYDSNLNQLFINAATFAAKTGHGYIGEFNGAVMAMASNSAGFSAMDLLTGSATATYAVTSIPHFIYDVGPIGAGNPIDAGVSFPFTDLDDTLFRTDISGALSGNIVDTYDDNGLPAVMANSPVINGGGAVPLPPSVLLFGSGLISLAGAGFGRKFFKKS